MMFNKYEKIKTYTNIYLDQECSSLCYHLKQMLSIVFCTVT